MNRGQDAQNGDRLMRKENFASQVLVDFKTKPDKKEIKKISFRMNYGCGERARR